LNNCIEKDFEKSCDDAIFVYKMTEEIARDTKSMNRISNGLGYCYRESG